MKTCEDCLHYMSCKTKCTLITDRIEKTDGNGLAYYDYMLSNQVDERCSTFADRSEWVHLPCKVENKVYVLEPCTCFRGYRSFEECHHKRTVATKWIKVVMIKNKHHNKCMKLFERPFKVEYTFKIGKTVFLTREEAEKALEDMKK